jgi:hypothetical protein
MTPEARAAIVAAASDGSTIPAPWELPGRNNIHHEPRRPEGKSTNDKMLDTENHSK